jgi:transcription initiation factor TFIIH subunit 3
MREFLKVSQRGRESSVTAQLLTCKAEPPPALLTIILDTNPHAWALLSNTLPLSKAVANVLVFINAHLATNYANRVAVIASHSQRAEYLYPSPPTSKSSGRGGSGHVILGNGAERGSKDTPMENGIGEPKTTLKLNGPKGKSNGQDNSKITADDANKYRPFRLVEEEVMSNLTRLMESTTNEDIEDNSTTMMAGALTMALAYINREIRQWEETGTGGGGARANEGGSSTQAIGDGGRLGLQSRVLVISVSGDLAFQYIPVMNCIFAAQRKVRISYTLFILNYILTTIPENTNRHTQTRRRHCIPSTGF